MKRVLVLSVVALALAAPAYAGRLQGNEIQAPRHLNGVYAPVRPLNGDEIQAPVSPDEIQAPRDGDGVYCC